MQRRAAQVTQADIARAIRALRSAGYEDVRVVLRPGEVIVEPQPEHGDRHQAEGEDEVERIFVI